MDYQIIPQPLHMSLQLLLESCVPDSWRAEVGFSDDIRAANDELFLAASDSRKQKQILNDWIRKHQPCLFGRAAAAQNAISYCIIGEADIQRGDEYVRELIQAGRLAWTREAFEGKKSAFVLLIVSPRMTVAKPSVSMLEIAKSVAAMNLSNDGIELDQIYHDNICLEVQASARTTWLWKAGVNYFSAQGDKRWWHDHRIPGGMAFSTNSVGHMAKSGKLSELLKQLEIGLGISVDERPNIRIDSLERALAVAMQTIDNATDGVSGRATELMPLPANIDSLPIPRCPVTLPTSISGMNHCAYKGYYHTDHTLPSNYFRDDVERPSDIEGIDNLDFTYLHHRSTENPAYFSMGLGLQIRASDPAREAVSASPKHSRFYGEKVLIADVPHLAKALALPAKSRG